MRFNAEEAKFWSVDRLKFEIDTRRQQIAEMQRDYADLDAEYERNPGAWQGDMPAGLTYIPRGIDRLRSEIGQLENIIRAKL